MFIARALDIHIFKLHPETEGRNEKDLKNALRFYEYNKQTEPLRIIVAL